MENRKTGGSFTALKMRAWLCRRGKVPSPIRTARGLLSAEIPSFHRERIDMQIGNEDIPGLAQMRCFAGIGPAGMLGLIAASGRDRERFVQAPNLPQKVRVIAHMLGDDVDDAAFRLDLAAACQHLPPENGPAMFLKERGPYDEIGNIPLVFKRDEHDALGRTRTLTHHHEAGNRHALTVLHVLQGCAWRDAHIVEPVTKERDRMGPQREPMRAVVLDDFAAFRHRR